MGILEAILMAVSLCADCFAVTLCSGVTLGKLRFRSVARVSLVFAVIQTGLLLVGWVFGRALSSYVITFSHIIGFVLLLYVGGSMFWEGLRGSEEVRNLSGWKGVLLGGLATSIDALAVGAAEALGESGDISLAGACESGFAALLVSVFVVTLIFSALGICGGRFIGARTGRIAEIIGGCVLIGIGISLLF